MNNEEVVKLSKEEILDLLDAVENKKTEIKDLNEKVKNQNGDIEQLEAQKVNPKFVAIMTCFGLSVLVNAVTGSIHDMPLVHCVAYSVLCTPVFFPVGYVVNNIAKGHNLKIDKDISKTNNKYSKMKSRINELNEEIVKIQNKVYSFVYGDHNTQTVKNDGVVDQNDVVIDQDVAAVDQDAATYTNTDAKVRKLVKND